MATLVVNGSGMIVSYAYVCHRSSMIDAMNFYMESSEECFMSNVGWLYNEE